jgi:RNA polymerase sigma-70 factor (ECF subfamily)
VREEIQIDKIWSVIHEKLYGFIFKYVNNSDDVNDIIQDTFIKVKINIDKLKNPAKLESWIFQIARNTMQDFFRHKNKSFTFKDDKNDFLLDVKYPEDDESIIISQTQMFSDYAGLVISELPNNYEIAVRRVDIEGKSTKELAEELNISISGAKSRVQRGRKMVKEIVLKCCDVKTDNYGNILDYKPNN